MMFSLLFTEAGVFDVYNLLNKLWKANNIIIIKHHLDCCSITFCDAQKP